MGMKSRQIWVTSGTVPSLMEAPFERIRNHV
jgi:hypothetical protein